MIRKTGKLIIGLSMMIIMCAACSADDDKDILDNTDTSVVDSVKDEESLYEESDNTAINSSNQNKDSSTLMEEMESDIESGAEELFDDSSDRSDSIDDNMQDENSSETSMN